MFSSNNGAGANAPGSKKYDTSIDVSLKCDGDLKFTGKMYFDGKLKGNISSDKNKNKNKNNSDVLVIGPNAKIIGNINAPDITVMGLVEGAIYSEGIIILMPGSVVCGDIHYKDMDMRHGSSVNGRFHHAEAKAQIASSSTSSSASSSTSTSTSSSSSTSAAASKEEK